MKNILEVKNLNVQVGTRTLFDKVSFIIEKGSFCVLSGDNGTGKSTLFNIASGYIKPQKKGDVFFNGISINTLQPYNVAALGLGRMFQNPRLFDNMTVLDNLMAFAKSQKGIFFTDFFLSFSKISTNEKMNKNKSIEILESFGMKDKAYDKADTLSYGQRKLLSLGCLLMAEPKLFMLDEPLAGVNKNVANIIFEKLKDMRNFGSTVFMIEHNSNLIEQLATQNLKIVNDNSGQNIITLN
jgi:ABC-type branched-subunit amino acid transport system ATPase component